MSTDPTADALAAAIEDSRQATLRKMARDASKHGPRHFFSELDTFDTIPGGMVVRRNNHTAKLTDLPDGDEYGIGGTP